MFYIEKRMTSNQLENIYYVFLSIDCICQSVTFGYVPSTGVDVISNIDAKVLQNHLFIVYS